MNAFLVPPVSVAPVAVGLVADDQVEPLIARDLLRGEMTSTTVRCEDDLQAPSLFVFRESARRWPSVVAGIPGPPPTPRPCRYVPTRTPVSEHTAHAVNALPASAAQSSSVCLRSASEGTKECDPRCRPLLHKLAQRSSGRERLTRAARHDHAAPCLEARHHRAAHAPGKQ